MMDSLDGMPCSIDGTSFQILEPPRALDPSHCSHEESGSQSHVHIASIVLADGGYKQRLHHGSITSTVALRLRNLAV